MAHETFVPRSASASASSVLEEVAHRKRRSIRLPDDRGWLLEHTPSPSKLLSDMAARQLVYRVGRGRYVVAPRGTFSVQQAAPVELLVDVLLGGRKRYYVGFLSALIAYRLTDLHSTIVYAAVPADGSVTRPPVLPGESELHLVALNPSRWPNPDAGEVERVRAFDEAKEFWWRSSLERTLVDALTRPDLSGGIETVVAAWTRARNEDRADWSEVARVASRMGPTAERRVAFLLQALGIEEARRWFADLDRRGSTVLFDRSDGFQMRDSSSRDRDTGVAVNVPPDRLSGWISGAVIG